jgi:hypothetical protein
VLLLSGEAVGKRGFVRAGLETFGMTQNFIACDRDQAYLMPPSLVDWVAEDHLVWSIIGSVEELDLDQFYADYRADGHGRPAYDPKMKWWRCFFTRTRAGIAHRGGSSGRVVRMWPIG